MFCKKKLKQLFNVSLVKKIFSENYYLKYYVRNNLLDNNDNFYNFKKNKLLGFSIYNDIYIYSHIYNNKFTFKSFLNKKNLNSKFFVQNFYTSAINSKNKKPFLFLLKPIKGGYRSYFSGFVSFLPKTHFLGLARKIRYKTVKTIVLFHLEYIFTNKNDIFKKLKIPLDIIKIKPVLFWKRKNFSRAKKIKSRRFFVSSVLLLNKKIKPVRSNETKKHKKHKKKIKPIRSNETKKHKEKNKTIFI